MPALHRQDNVFVLDLGDGENRFHPDWIAAVDTALGEVEKTDEPRALVTAATGKFYSNGLDLDWLSAHADQHQDYVISVQELFARVLSLPVITVAALQGHTFAAGAMFSLAQDFRVMRADRGFWCLPEADINIPFTPGMAALIQARLTPQTAHEAMLHRTPIWRDHGGSRQHRRPGGGRRRRARHGPRARERAGQQGRRHPRHHQGPDVRPGAGRPARYHHHAGLTGLSGSYLVNHAVKPKCASCCPRAGCHRETPRGVAWSGPLSFGVAGCSSSHQGRVS